MRSSFSGLCIFKMFPRWLKNSSLILLYTYLSKIGLVLLYMWLEIRGRKGRKNTTRKSTNGQETDNEYINEIRNGGVGGRGRPSKLRCAKEVFPQFVPFCSKCIYHNSSIYYLCLSHLHHTFPLITLPTLPSHTYVHAQKTYKYGH